MSRVAIVVLCVAPAAFGQIGLPPSSKILIQTMLTAVDYRQRAEAARVLGLTGDPRVLESLAMAANHDTMPEVRRAAKQSIRQIQGATRPPVVPPIGPVPPPVVDPNVTLIESCYQRYLGRTADRAGLIACVEQLRRGVPQNDVLATMILGSDEFWDRSGRSPDGFIIRLYQTVLGRTPNAREKGGWLGTFARNLRNRPRTAAEFLAAAQRELLDRSKPNPLAPW